MSPVMARASAGVRERSEKLLDVVVIEEVQVRVRYPGQALHAARLLTDAGQKGVPAPSPSLEPPSREASRSPGCPCGFFSHSAARWRIASAGRTPLRADGHQGAARVEGSVVMPSFVLGNSHPDQGAEDAATRRARQSCLHGTNE